MPIRIEIKSLMLRTGEKQEEKEKTREQRFEELFKEYSKHYPKLMAQPTWRSMCKQMIRMQLEVERLWNYLEVLWVQDTDGRTEYRKWFKELRDAIRTLNLIQTRMGLTFTSQPYVPVKDREVKTARQISEMEQKIGKISVEMKKRAEKKKQSNRTNPHRGRREIKHGEPAKQEEEKLEQKEEKQNGS